MYSYMINLFPECKVMFIFNTHSGAKSERMRMS